MGNVSLDDLTTRLAKARQERDFLKSILDAIQSFTVLVVDTVPLAQIRFANSFCCYHAGVPYEKAVTMNAYDFVSTPDDEISRINGAIETCMKGQGPVYIQGYFRSRDSQGAAKALMGFMIVQRLDRPGASPCLMFTTLDTAQFASRQDHGELAQWKTNIERFIKENPPAPPVQVDLFTEAQAQEKIEELEREKDFFKLILDTLHKISILVVDTEPMAQVRFANHCFCWHNAVTYDKAITMNAYEFASTPDDEIQKINGAIEKAMKGEGPVTINGYFRSRGDDAEERANWATMIIQRLDLPNVSPKIMFTTISTSELGIGAESENVNLARVQAITTATNDAVALLDETGKVTYWNVVAEKLFRIVANQAMGRELPELIIHPSVREEFKRSWAKAVDLDKPSFEGSIFESIASCNGGDEFFLEVSAGPLRLENGAWGAVGFFRDITPRKKMEADLLSAKQQAENANKLKDQFVALVSHDLRSPLANVVGMLEVLKGKAANSLKPEEMFYLNRAVDNCGRLMSMIDRLLDVSRLKSGKVKLKKRFIDVAQAIEDWLEISRRIADEKGIKIIVEIPLGFRIFADEMLFCQVIQNVVGNSVKFCKVGDIITIQPEKNRPDVLVIRDTGPGVEEKFIPNLFNASVRTTTPGSKGEKGIGLGLSLCHDIIKSHGGQISVESNPGHGATFYIELPQVKALVLLVEDQDVIRQEMAEYINNMGADVIEAANGQEAIALLADTQPHLVITDVMMPHVDGWDLLRFIRKDYSMETLPVIVITSSGQREAREVAFQLGANDFVLKPVIPDEFLPRVKRFLR